MQLNVTTIRSNKQDVLLNFRQISEIIVKTIAFYKAIQKSQILISFTKCDVQYASGYSSVWTNVACIESQIYAQTISFPEQFSRIPQVSVNPCIIISGYSNQAEMGFDFSITTITQSYFIVNLKAHVNTVQYYTFYWIAIDDMRIEILTNFNIANPQSTILQHNNAYANTGIIFFTSFHSQTKIDFTLGLGTITTTTVEVNIVQQNMKSMGYIVILGPKEFFATESQIIGVLLMSIPEDKLLFFQFIKSLILKTFYFLKRKIVQLFSLQNLALFYAIFYIQCDQQSADSTTYSSYKFCTWAGFSTNFATAAHQCATLTFTLQTTKPILFHKLKISGLILLDQSNIIELSIPEASKTYEQQVTNDQIIVPNNLQSLTFNLRILCNKKYQITGQFYQCDSPCSNQYKKITRQCYDLEAALQFLVTYNIQNIGHYQYLTVDVTSSYCQFKMMTKNYQQQIKVHQTVLNQVSSEQLICQFDVE